jgi:homoserine O-acetyltransferase
MSASLCLPPQIELCHLPAEFPLASGESLRGAVLACERQGPANAPVVVVLGGISAGRHVSAHAAVPGPGWWEGIVGPGLAIDTNRWQVLAIDWLGGHGASTAPAAGESFPLVGPADQAAALAVLLDRLRLPPLRALVGCSYGGMVGLQFAAQFPQHLQQLVVIAAAHRNHAQAVAQRALQRGIVELGLRHGAGAAAVALARGLALCSYRTPQEFAERFANASGGDWLLRHGARFAEQWTAEQYLSLCRSLDAHAIKPAAVTVPTSLCSIVDDQLVPPELMAELAAGLPQLRRLQRVRSRYGHDGFLKETRTIGSFLREVLA